MDPSPAEADAELVALEREEHRVIRSMTLDEPNVMHNQSALPPADRGKDAWLFLIASFFLEGLVWGFPYSFGVFQDYYQSHLPFAGSSNIATIGTCAMGVLFFMFPIVIAIQRMYPRQARWAPVCGLVVMSLALLTSSFSQTVPHLIITQGVIYALAGSIAYCPCMGWLGEWFVERRGFGYGVMWSGSGIGGCTIPLILESLLQKYGFRTTLRIWAVALLVLTIPVAYFIKPRLPTNSTMPFRPSNLSFILDRTFMLYQAASIIESLGFFLPLVYLPTYARTILGAKPFLASLTKILANGSTAIGMAIIGSLTDRLHVTTCIMICTVGAVLGTFLLWGFATHLAILYVFSVVYGLFAGSYMATWPGIVRQVNYHHMDEGTSTGGQAFDPTMILGILTAGRGIGNIISGPLSGILLDTMASHRGAWAWNNSYGTIVAFTGSTALIGGITCLWKQFGWIR